MKETNDIKETQLTWWQCGLESFHWILFRITEQDCNSKLRDFSIVHSYWFTTFSTKYNILSYPCCVQNTAEIGQCKMQPADWLWTFVFRVGKQWENFCHILIYTVKTIVRSLYFSLTAVEIHPDWTFDCFKIISVNWASKSFWTLAILDKNKLFCHRWSNLERLDYCKWKYQSKNKYSIKGLTEKQCHKNFFSQIILVTVTIIEKGKAWFVEKPYTFDLL